MWTQLGEKKIAEYVRYVNGKYYTLSEDIPSFNGIAELAPTSATASATPLRIPFSKRGLTTPPTPLRLGKQIEVINF